MAKMYDKKSLACLEMWCPDWRNKFATLDHALEAYGIEPEEVEDYHYDEDPEEVDLGRDDWYNPDLAPDPDAAEDYDENY